MTPSLLHVASGHSTTGTIREAGIPGTLSIWADPLHDGPVPSEASDDELVVIRARHLSAGDGAPSLDDAVAGLREWRTVVDDRAAYDEVVLWYEHDLFDQLNLIQLLDRLAGQESRTPPVTLICIDTFPGHPHFKGLGELSPGDLGSLFGTRQPVTGAQYDLASRAWSLFRAADPRELSAFLETDTSALPFLAPALRRHLQEFPWTTDGLSRTERRLMTLVQSEPTDIWSVFPSMHVGETAFYIADTSLWDVSEALADAQPRVLTRDVMPRGSGRLPTATLALTDLGRSVLEGRADRIDSCGIDRWLGGTHLSVGGPMYRWDDERQNVVRA